MWRLIKIERKIPWQMKHTTNWAKSVSVFRWDFCVRRFTPQLRRHKCGKRQFRPGTKNAAHPKCAVANLNAALFIANSSVGAKFSSKSVLGFSKCIKNAFALKTCTGKISRNPRMLQTTRRGKIQQQNWQATWKPMFPQPWTLFHARRITVRVFSSVVFRIAELLWDHLSCEILQAYYDLLKCPSEELRNWKSWRFPVR